MTEPIINQQIFCDRGDTLCKGSLGFHRIQDPALYDMYAKYLLKRGWPGIITPEELAFRNELKPPSEIKKERGRALSARRDPLPLARKDGTGGEDGERESKEMGHAYQAGILLPETLP